MSALSWPLCTAPPGSSSRRSIAGRERPGGSRARSSCGYRFAECSTASFPTRASSEVSRACRCARCRYSGAAQAEGRSRARRPRRCDSIRKPASGEIALGHQADAHSCRQETRWSSTRYLRRPFGTAPPTSTSRLDGRRCSGTTAISSRSTARSSTETDLESALAVVTAARAAARRAVSESGDLDIAYTADELPRFRVNVFRQRGATSMALRVIPREVPRFTTSAFRARYRSSPTSTAGSCWLPAQRARGRPRRSLR